MSGLKAMVDVSIVMRAWYAQVKTSLTMEADSTKGQSQKSTTVECDLQFISAPK